MKNLFKNDFFIFGPETRGLPEDLMSLDCITDKVRLPMLANSRSLNLSNCAAILLYEAWRQNDFAGGVTDSDLR